MRDLIITIFIYGYLLGFVLLVIEGIKLIIKAIEKKIKNAKKTKHKN